MPLTSTDRLKGQRKDEKDMLDRYLIRNEDNESLDPLLQYINV